MVYTEKDFRRVLWQAVDPDFEGERPSTIRLAADIYLTRPIELGAYQYNVTIDGSGRFSILNGAGFTGGHLFSFPNGSISDIDFNAVIFGLTNIYSVFNGSASTAVSDFVFKECSIDLSGNTPSGAIWTMFSGPSSILSTMVDLDSYPPSPYTFVLTLPVGAGGSTFTGAFSIGPYFTQYEQSNAIFKRDGYGVSCRSSQASTVAITINGAAAFSPESITLTGADPTITPYQFLVEDRTFFKVTIVNAAPFGATGEIQIAPGVNGQLLVLYFTNTASSVRLADNSTVNVDKNHSSKHPLAREIVSFIYIDGKWREIARSENV